MVLFKALFLLTIIIKYMGKGGLGSIKVGGAHGGDTVRQRTIYILTVFLLAILLTGCFGGGSKGPQGEKTIITGRVLVPNGTPLDEETTMARSFSTTAYAFSIGQPLKKGQVIAYETPSFRPIGQVAETDAQGRYTLTGIPQGKSVIILAQKTTSQGKVRLSTYIPKVEKETKSEVTAITSLATEALKARMDEETTILPNEGDWQALQAAVKELVHDDDLDFTVGKGIVEEEIGKLPENYKKELNDALTLNRAIELGHLIHDVRHNVFSRDSQLVNYGESFAQEFTPSLNLVADALEVMVSAINSHYEGDELSEEYEIAVDPKKGLIKVTDGMGSIYRLTIKPFPEKAYDVYLAKDYTVSGDFSHGGEQFGSFHGTVNINWTSFQAVERVLFKGRVETKDSIVIDGSFDLGFALTAKEEFYPATITGRATLSSPILVAETRSFSARLVPISGEYGTDLLVERIDLQGSLTSPQDGEFAYTGRLGLEFTNLDSIDPDAEYGEGNYLASRTTLDGQINLAGQTPMTITSTVKTTAFDTFATERFQVKQGEKELTARVMVKFQEGEPKSVIMEDGSYRGLKFTVQYGPDHGDTDPIGTIDDQQGCRVADIYVDRIHSRDGQEIYF